MAVNASGVGPPPASGRSQEIALPPSDDRSQPPPAERFATLDAYLQHRRELGAQDYPYYEEIRPGVYARVGGRPPRRPQPPETFTREQLAAMYGFGR